ncbi:baseplate J/gp47 family protein [Afifella pfennigii]|uniref:baseplate J/gp47 family protein n=1 Tax=Afifella pfennigii TaxID=209897 RepID=UPI00047D0093|nr:baseplate J/gp47 family protein [Afifella pfennigii]
MPWPTRKASTIAERIAATLEEAISKLREDLSPLAISRAVRSGRGMLAQLGRAVALELREVHDHISWWGRQYFPDTAEEEFVYRHAGIWGITPRGATAAIGTVTIEGAAGTALPAGIEFAGSDGTVYVSTEAGEIAPNGETSVAVAAVETGTSGNLEAGIRLATVLPFPAITRVTVGAEGIAGGAAEETWQELRLRLLAHIRQRPHGGAAFDYPTWLESEFDVRAVNVVPEWIGRGSVGVVVAIKEGTFGRAPTVDEVEAMQVYLGRFGKPEGVRPVTARVVVVAADVVELPVRLRLRPDTVAARAAVEEAFQRFVATIGDDDDEENAGPIGARIEPSRISEAISAAAGEYAHDLLEPTAPYVLDRKAYPVPGTITFEAAA